MRQNSINFDNVVEAETQKKWRVKPLNLTMIDKMTPRTDARLRTSERLSNIELENTREIREIEMKNQKAQ